MPWARRRPFVALLAASLVLPACGGSGSSRPDRPAGPPLQVIGPWSGTEQARFTDVLAAFTAASGVRVRYVSYQGRYLPDLLDARLARGDAPDVALLPQPGMLRNYADRGKLVPLDAATRRTVAAHYATGWRELATSAGREYGVWFKAAHKSLVWYDVATFERAGVVPPDELPALERLASTLTSRGTPAFAVGGADGWVLTDWFENVYLRLAGPARYDRLAAHRLPWTDASVTRALAYLGRLLSPAHLLGGVRGAGRSTFPASVAQAFGPPARAAMLAEGDFVAGFLPAALGRRIGTDVDVFPFPGTYDGLPMVVGGGDVAVQMTSRAAAGRLLTFLATPQAAAIWAARGGFVSPNLDVDLQAYPAGVSRSVARNLLEAGSGFRFDLSDLQPATFGSAPRSGMQGALRQFLQDGNVAAAQIRLEAGAKAAWG